MSANLSPSFAGLDAAGELPQRDTPTGASVQVSASADSARPFLDDIRPVRARRTDPSTSHEAAARVWEFASAHHQRVMDALRRAGGRAGAEQIAFVAGMDAYAVRKRLPELAEAGAVRVTDDTAMTRSGRRERIWVVVG